MFEDKKWPTALKEVVIKSLFKSGEEDKIFNYRLITLISNFANIFEKIIKVRGVNYLNKDKLW